MAMEGSSGGTGRFEEVTAGLGVQEGVSGFPRRFLSQPLKPQVLGLAGWVGS